MWNHFLANIQEICIGLVDGVRWDCVLRFLQLNRSVRKFSMIGTVNNFRDFAYATIIASEELNGKMENRTLQFMVERDCDGSLAKYAIRYLNWSLFENQHYNKRLLMQLCTYAELSLTTARENYVYLEGVEQMRCRYTNGRNSYRVDRVHPAIENVEKYYF